jgi:triphosphoribosyl-dephospho-CoA synthase
MRRSREQIRDAYEDACRLEIDALKPGNVHRFAGGHGMSAEEFITSARVSSGPLTEPGSPVGQRILEAVRATRRAVGTNTNLGIILLCAPLVRAAEIPGNLRENLTLVLDGLTIEDAQAALAAIVLASPGGLGSAEAQDVRQSPTVDLREAMRLAAGRDRVARQYSTCFQDVFEVGLPVFDAAVARGERGMWPTVFLYMTFLAAFPDSHVARRHGEEVAGRLRSEAEVVRAALGASGNESERIGLLMEYDRKLKQRGLNPGTSADLTVASLFVASLLVHLRGDGLHSGNVDG